MSPGRKPSRSPASTAGRVRMIRLTLRGERRRRHRHREEGLAGAGRADAEGDRVAPDRVDIALLVDASSARPGCCGGARRRPRGSAPGSRAASSAPVTASIVPGATSWPRSISSTSSSTTVAARLDVSRVAVEGEDVAAQVEVDVAEPCPRARAAPRPRSPRARRRSVLSRVSCLRAKVPDRVAVCASGTARHPSVQGHVVRHLVSLAPRS